MKKFLSVLLLVSMLLSILAGCRGDGSSSLSSGDEQTAKEPFVLATKIDDLIVGGDFAGAKNPFRCVNEIELYEGSSKGTADNNCLRATGTSYCIAKYTNVAGGKYILRYWLKDNGASEGCVMKVYVNAQALYEVQGTGNNRWTEFSSNMLNIPDNATVTIRFDVTADYAKEPVVIELDEVSFERVPYDYPDMIRGENPVSYLDNDMTWVVNGERMIVRSAFADNLDVSKFKDNGYNTFCYTVSASDDVSKIDEAIKTAENNDLYLQIFYNIKGTDVNNKKNLEADKEALGALMKRVAEKDTKKKVISINLSNPFVVGRYTTANFDEIPGVTYFDALAAVVKTSNHPMITSVSMQNNEMPHYIYNTEYIDFNCSEISTDDMLVAYPTVSNVQSRVGAVAKTTATKNLSSLMMKAYALGGYAASATLVEDEAATSTNKKIINVESLLLAAPKENKTSFNTGVNLNNEYVGKNKIGEVIVKFEAYVDNGPVGIAFYKDKAAYCIADKMSFFSAYGVDAVGVAGSFDENGNFVEEEEKIFTQDAEDGSYRCDYTGKTVIKFTYYLPTEIEPASIALEPLYDIKYLEPQKVQIGVNLIPGNGGFEDGVQPFKEQRVTLAGQFLYNKENAGNKAYGGSKASVTLYCANDPKNIYAKCDLGVLPAGTYGIMARNYGGKCPSAYDDEKGTVESEGYYPDQFRVQIVANGKVVHKMQMNGNGSGWVQYIDMVTLTGKARVSFELVVELHEETSGMWAHIDGLEFVKIA